jgi:hypothetical protein
MRRAGTARCRQPGEARIIRAGRARCVIRTEGGSTGGRASRAYRLSDDGDLPVGLPGWGQAGRMLMTRERTTTRTPREISDWIAISPLARRVNGSVSVGLKATTLVKAT